MSANDEPALIAGAVGAVLTLLVAFGVPITPDQRVAIIGVAGPAYALGAAFWIRHKSTPNTKLPVFDAGAPTPPPDPNFKEGTTP